MPRSQLYVGGQGGVGACERGERGREDSWAEAKRGEAAFPLLWGVQGPSSHEAAPGRPPRRGAPPSPPCCLEPCYSAQRELIHGEGGGTKMS